MPIPRSHLLPLSVCIFTGCSTHLRSRPARRARIARAQAEEVALHAAPGGKIKEGELEEERGRWVWSFDIAHRPARSIVERQVDAVSGTVVRREIESPMQQAREAARDRVAKN